MSELGPVSPVSLSQTRAFPITTIMVCGGWCCEPNWTMFSLYSLQSGNKARPETKESNHILLGSHKHSCACCLPDTLCTQLGDYLHEWTQGFRGLCEWGVGPPSPGGYKHGRKLVYRPPPGAGQCFRGRDSGYFPNSFGRKLSVQENTLCLCTGPMVGAGVAFWPGRRDIPPHALAGGLA